MAPLVNFIEVARPIVDTLGPTDLGSGAWSYARVTQHTQVGKQAGEKTELASPQDADHEDAAGCRHVRRLRQRVQAGHQPHVARRSSTWSSTTSPQQYAIETEEEAADGAVRPAATAGPGHPDRHPTARQRRHRDLDVPPVRCSPPPKGQGRTVVAVSPDMLGMHRPDLPAGQPDERLLDRVLRRPHRPGRAGLHRRADRHHVGRSRHRTRSSSTRPPPRRRSSTSTATCRSSSRRCGVCRSATPATSTVVVIEPAGVVKVTKTP